MAKFRQGDLVLQNTQRIIQGTEVVLLDDQAAYLQTLNVSSLSNLTTLVLDSGVQIDEFSNDGTLAGATPDTIVPTEYAVKTYVDNKISGSIGAGVNESVAIYDGSDSIKDSLVFIDSTGGVTGIANLSVDEDIDAFDISASGDILAVGNVTCNDLYTTGSTIHVDSGQIKSSGVNIELYHNGIKEFETIVGGIRINDSFDITADSTATTMTGNLDVAGDTITLENGQIKSSAGNIELYYDELLRLSTDSDGVNITGDTINLGTGAIKSSAGNVELYDDGLKTFETFNDGVFTGISVYGTAGERFDITMNSGTLFMSSLNDGVDIEVASTNSASAYKRAYHFDPDAGITFYYDGADVAHTISGGFQADSLLLSLGATVNEFSTDVNLTGDSDFAVPTEHAVKTYVDNAVGTPNEIIQGNSYVRVSDTGTGVITVAVDGNNVMNITNDLQTVGLAADTNMTIVQSTNTISFECGNVEIMDLAESGQQIGVNGDTYISLNQISNTAYTTVGGSTLLQIRTNLQAMGDYGPGGSFIAVNNTVNTSNIIMNGNNAADFTSTYQRLFYSGTPALTTTSGGGVTVNGRLLARDHGTGSTAEVVNVVYGTGSPPTASTTPIGTIFVKYIP